MVPSPLIWDADALQHGSAPRLEHAANGAEIDRQVLVPNRLNHLNAHQLVKGARSYSWTAKQHTFLEMGMETVSQCSSPCQRVQQMHMQAGVRVKGLGQARSII